jgi:hypothetical protein
MKSYYLSLPNKRFCLHFFPLTKTNVWKRKKRFVKCSSFNFAWPVLKHYYRQRLHWTPFIWAVESNYQNPTFSKLNSLAKKKFRAKNFRFFFDPFLIRYQVFNSPLLLLFIFKSWGKRGARLRNILLRVGVIFQKTEQKLF